METIRFAVEGVPKELWHQVKVAAAVKNMKLREFTLLALRNQLVTDSGAAIAPGEAVVAITDTD